MSKEILPENRRAEDHLFNEELVPASPAQEHLGIDDLKELTLKISADLGQCHVSVREVLELQRGSVLKLDKFAGEMADVYINDIFFGKGEIVVLVDSLNVRLAEIVGATEKDAGYA